MKILNYRIIVHIFSAFLVVAGSCASGFSAMPEQKTFKAANNNINTLSVLDSIRVYTGNTAGKDKIISLRIEGYTCKPALSKLWRCTTHLENWNHETAIVQSRIEKVVQEASDVSFGRLWKNPEISHVSQAYSEWEVGQYLKLGELNTKYFRWRSLKGTDYLKLLPGKQGFVEEYLWQNEQLSKIVSFSLSHRDGYTRYVIEIPYE